MFNDWCLISLNNKHGDKWQSRLSYVLTNPTLDDIIEFKRTNPKFSFAVFKNGIKPEYEDLKNAGRFFFECLVVERMKILEKFLNTPELMEEENISGIYFGKKKKFTIWVKTRDPNEINVILDKIRIHLDLVNYKWEDFEEDQERYLKEIQSLSDVRYIEWNLFKCDTTDYANWEEKLVLVKTHPSIDDVVNIMKEYPNHGYGVFKQGYKPVGKCCTGYICHRKLFYKFFRRQIFEIDSPSFIYHN